MEQLQKPLTAKEIDFRVQSINKVGYATILAYKDARVDMKRLDEVFGVYGWQRDYKQVGQLMLCGVSVWDKDRKQWVTKWDTGTESNTEAQKGLASDSFKRACFNLGIGRELYDYPTIQVQLLGDGSGEKDEWIKQGRNGKPQATWNLRLKDWTWFTEWSDGRLTYIGVKDQNGKLRWDWGQYNKDAARYRKTFNACFSMADESDEVTWVKACLQMLEIQQEASQELWDELMDFDTEKTKNKDRVNKMCAAGRAVWNKACDDYADHKANDRKLGMRQLEDDLPEYWRKRLLEL